MTAPAPLVLIVPMPPNVTNRARGSTHWRRAWGSKNSYLAALDTLSAYRERGITTEGVRFVVPPPPTVPFGRVTLTADYVLRGAMDDDNAAARAKHLLDWLVTRGYLASDRRTCVRWAAFPTQRVTRKEPARITLTLTPTEPCLRDQST